MPSPSHEPYGKRALKQINPAAKLLLETMERKKSNLAVSVDVTKARDFLAIADVVGPYVCLIKTHIDIIEDFTTIVTERLQHLSSKHDFLIFEDRKFADIGKTVALQYSGKPYQIASWAHITNAHALPGPSIIAGLSSVGLPLKRGLLLLAEMSTEGSLTTGTYVKDVVRMARAHREFVIGFIAQRRLECVDEEENIADKEEDFLILTPGVGLHEKGDGMGQRYRTPKEVVLDLGCDVIIVGRGIYGQDFSQVDVIAARAERYMAEGWAAYLERLS